LAHFKDAQSGETLVETINAARAVVIPSRCQEGFNMTGLEAISCGQCIIGALDGGMAEMLPGAALVFPPGDAVALAAHMRQVCQDPHLAGEYRERARERSLSFTIDRMAAQYINLLERVAR
jgi:glycosyltransferase involved in cell wall biosynthesis